jgi:hypothetical protein
MKKETLEEAAEKYADFSNDFIPMSFSSTGKYNETSKRDFIAGANFQSERMYSEEEILTIIKAFDKDFYQGIVERNGHTNKWFEQFKKK